MGVKVEYIRKEGKGKGLNGRQQVYPVEQQQILASHRNKRWRDQRWHCN
jgi:hypothetical protein